MQPYLPVNMQRRRKRILPVCTRNTISTDHANMYRERRGVCDVIGDMLSQQSEVLSLMDPFEADTLEYVGT